MVGTSAKQWSRQETKATRALAENRELIEQSARGLPAGRERSRHTTASAGYVSIKARYGGHCLTCQRKITPGRQVRYWFGIGLTCRSCPLGAPKGNAKGIGSRT